MILAKYAVNGMGKYAGSMIKGRDANGSPWRYMERAARVRLYFTPLLSRIFQNASACSAASTTGCMAYDAGKIVSFAICMTCGEMVHTTSTRCRSTPVNVASCTIVDTFSGVRASKLAIRAAFAAFCTGVGGGPTICGSMGEG
jgi:hypothetical protein